MVIWLGFAVQHVKVLYLGHDNRRWPYHIGDDLLEAVSEEEDLGLIVDDKFKFHNPTQAQVAKENQDLGLRKRKFTTRKPCVVNKLYKAIALPHLEFGMTLASPQYKMDIKALKSVQRWATKLISALQDKPYEEQLVSLKLPNLDYWRKRGDAITTSKLIENDLSSQVFSSSHVIITRGHTKKLQVPYCHQHECKHFFSVCAVPHWNSLSEANIQSQTIDVLKKGVDHDWANTECRLTWDTKP